MQVETQAGEQSPVFRPIDVKVTSTDPPAEVLDQNIRHNMAQDWQRFHKRADWVITGKIEGRSEKPIAICAGGPSLKDFIGKIHDDFTDVMACGSAHDFLIKNGVDPTYSVQCDGHPLAKKFFQLRLPNIQYLMASQCDPIMFEGLNPEQVWLWHCAKTDELDGCDKDFQSEPAIGGGCTTTLRAMNLAIMMGYHNLHFFGFDSCFEDIQNQHAYDYQEYGSQLIPFGVKVDNQGKVFKSNALFLAQAQQFQEMCKSFGNLFEPTVHGDGLIAEMIKVGLKKLQEKAA